MKHDPARVPQAVQEQVHAQRREVEAALAATDKLIADCWITMQHSHELIAFFDRRYSVGAVATAVALGGHARRCGALPGRRGPA
jgi:hypothetical protein